MIIDICGLKHLASCFLFIAFVPYFLFPFILPSLVLIEHFLMIPFYHLHLVIPLFKTFLVVALGFTISLVNILSLLSHN